MLKLSTFAIVLSCTLTDLSAQMEILNTHRHTIQARIDLINEQFEVVNQSSQAGAYIQDVDVQLVFGELSIGYDLERTKAEEYFTVEIAAYLDDSRLVIHPDDLLGDAGRKLDRTNNEARRIVWRNLLDRYTDLRGNLRLELSVSLWGIPELPFGIICGEPPVFRGKGIHYAVAGLGAAAVAAGVFLFDEAESDYQNNYLTQNFENAAEQAYLDANEKRHIGILMRYGGMAMIAADAGIFIYRFFRHRKKVRTYNELCHDQVVGISPFYRADHPGGNNQLGLKLSIAF